MKASVSIPSRSRKSARSCAPILARLEQTIYQHAGGPFNIGSPKQLGEVLFGKLALDPNAKKTKTGQFSTDEATLTALAPKHPIIAEVLEHREASKLLSTYIDALPNSIAADGRIHTTFYQLATTTGRLNLQGSRTCRISRSAPRRVARFAALSSRARATTGSSPPTTRRSNCASSPR